MLLFISFPLCLLAISITKTHSSPTSKLRHFFNQFFGLHPKFYSQISNFIAAKAQTFIKCCWLNILSGSKKFHVTAHFRAVSQAKTECENRHILSRFDTCPVQPYPQTEKWPYQAFITSNCTTFLNDTHKILLLEIMQNASSTTRYFFW